MMAGLLENRGAFTTHRRTRLQFSRDQSWYSLKTLTPIIISIKLAMVVNFGAKLDQVLQTSESASLSTTLR